MVNLFVAAAIGIAAQDPRWGRPVDAPQSASFMIDGRHVIPCNPNKGMPVVWLPDVVVSEHYLTRFAVDIQPTARHETILFFDRPRSKRWIHLKTSAR